MFGVSTSVVSEIVNQFCIELVRSGQHMIHFPTNGHESAVAVEHFGNSTDCRIPNVVGAIDCTHVEIKGPETESQIDYFDQKQRYSIATQAVVEGNLLFLDVALGFPGSIHDARILRRSTLHQKANAEEILDLPQVIIAERIINPLIISDGAYPPLRWILKGGMSRF